MLFDSNHLNKSMQPFTIVKISVLSDIHCNGFVHMFMLGGNRTFFQFDKISRVFVDFCMQKLAMQEYCKFPYISFLNAKE